MEIAHSAALRGDDGGETQRKSRSDAASEWRSAIDSELELPATAGDEWLQHRRVRQSCVPCESEADVV